MERESDSVLREDVAAQAGRLGRRIGVLALLAVISVALSACADLFGSGDSDGAPALVQSEPAAFSQELSVLTQFTLTFSVKVDPSSLEEGIRLLDATDRVIRTRATLLSPKRVLFTPTDPLDFGEAYDIEITALLSSRSGTPVAEPSRIQFDTEGERLPPMVADSLLIHLEVLAHDSMRGREAGTQDELRAAQYIAGRLQDYGLEAPTGGAIRPFQAQSATTQQMLDSRNVLALVPGRGTLAQEWVVLGAHYDGLGVRPYFGSVPQVHNGADDNGSGTALLLELARVYRSHLDQGGMAERDRRSVLFAAFGGEERGLLGSWYYTHFDAVAPLALTVAMMNFDMVGMLRDGEAFLFGGETAGEWEDLSHNANVQSHSLTFLSMPACRYCSDHAYFLEGGIPYLWPETGPHNWYHTPLDDVEYLNVSGMVSIGEWAIRVLSRLVVMPEAPAFVGEG